MVVKTAFEAGIKAVALFPQVPKHKKTKSPKEAVNPDNLMCRTIREIKSKTDLGIIADVALDPYTVDGHDGICHDGKVHNDATLPWLVEQALLFAEAGADVVAPSDMMDGRIGAVRTALESAGKHDTQILSYAVKYASSLYGPFRDAIGAASAKQTINKASYQMNPSNSREAMRELELDLAEGADHIMVKPAGFYLDVIHALRPKCPIPLWAYQVSGEYAMLQSAILSGLLAPQVMMESLLAIKRAGADVILSYAALEIARDIGS